MKFITLTLLVCAALLTGCMSYSSTLHTSIYHGTDDHAGLSDFYYLQYAVSGSASASYDFRGGGFVREGLLAEAKKNLMRQFPLGPNQAYANVAIDDLHTSSGMQDLEGNRATSKIVITVVISADIIQYGTPPANYERPLSNSSGSLSFRSSSNSIDAQHSELNSQRSFSKGDKVTVMISGKHVEGLVLNKISDSSGSDYKVQFLVDGKKKSKFFSGKDVFDLDEKEEMR